VILLLAAQAGAQKPPHVFFLAGDDEYRAEETMPLLARILARECGVRVTVSFSTDAAGNVDPDNLQGATNLEALKDADLLVMQLRFREYPWETLKPILDYAESGRPLAAFRPTTAPFRYRGEKAAMAIPGGKAAYAIDTFGEMNAVWTRRMFGQVFCGHFGAASGTAVEIIDEQKDHPILRGIKPFECRSGLYKTQPFAGPVTLLLRGRALGAPRGKSQEPPRPPEPYPVAWLWSYKTATGKDAQVFYTSLGHPDDFRSEFARRLAVNAMLYLLGREVPGTGARAELPGPYAPNASGIGTHKTDLKPEDLLPPEKPEDKSR
jgi:type 1 glutamine amidotransferase